MKLKFRFSRSESGATSIEYCLIIALIVQALISVAWVVGDNLNNTFETANNGMNIETASVASTTSVAVSAVMSNPNSGGGNGINIGLKQPKGN